MIVCQREHDVVVVKIGGSVLTTLAAYERCARFIRDRVTRVPHERLVVVVSARCGVTDRLQALAYRLCPKHDKATRELLWSTGELYSVSVLTLCLRGLEIRAVGLNAHQTGIRALGGSLQARRVACDASILRRHVAENQVIVVPGFLARGPLDSIITLGRGGSDLSAVVIAAGLEARRCELIKDVPGYFSKDPNVYPEASPLDVLTFDQALGMAASGCDLVFPRAIEMAARTNTPLLVRGLGDDAPHTILHAAEESGSNHRALSQKFVCEH